MTVIAIAVLVALTFGFVLGLLAHEVRSLIALMRYRPVLKPDELDDGWLGEWPPFPSSVFTDEREVA